MPSCVSGENEAASSSLHCADSPSKNRSPSSSLHCFSLDLCERIYQARKSYGAVIPGLPVTDTIKRVEKGIVQESVDRSSLYRIQTPQAFSFSLLWEAYNAFLEKKEEELSITDDAMMVEAFTQEQPYLVLGEEQNQKITVPEDLLYLKFLEEHSKQ